MNPEQLLAQAKAKATIAALTLRLEAANAAEKRAAEPKPKLRGASRVDKSKRRHGVYAFRFQF